MKCYLIGLLFFGMTAGFAMEGSGDRAWIGQHFPAAQLVALRDGEATFARKLCTIQYLMRRQEAFFAVEGRLTFNPRFVPRRPRAIDLEILLISAAGICTRQINQHLMVTADEVVFVFQVPPTADTRYLRTYYTLHY